MKLACKKYRGIGHWSAVCACAGLVASVGSAARGVVTGNGATNATGTYAGTGTALDGTTIYGYDHVGLNPQNANGSVVYIGNGYYLTANHVNIAGGLVPVQMDSGNYDIVGNTGVSDNNGGRTDLSVLQGSTVSDPTNPSLPAIPNLAPIAFATSSPVVGTVITYVGYGRTNAPPPASNAVVNYWSATGSGSGPYVFTNLGTTYNAGMDDVGGYNIGSDETQKHWGISATMGVPASQVNSVNPTQGAATYTIPYVNSGNTLGQVVTDLSSFYADPLNDYRNHRTNAAYLAAQAGLAAGDSGGGTFANNRLVGINDANGGFNGQDLATTEMFGDLSFSVDIATYLANILTISKQGQWNLAGSGTWASASWAAGVVPNGDGASANFLDAMTGAATVTNAGTITLANINFVNNNAIGISGGTIDLSYTDATVGSRAAMLAVWTPQTGVAGSDTISSLLSVGTVAKVTLFTQSGTLILNGGIMNAGSALLEKTGAGSLTLDGLQTQGAGTIFNVSGGKMRLNSDLGGAAKQDNVQLNLTNAGTASLVIGSTEHLAGLSLAAGVTATMDANGGRAIFTNALSLGVSSGGNWTSKLELTDNDLALTTTAANAAGDLANVVDMVKQGKGGAFGITSSSATPTRGLGVALSTQLSDPLATFDGDMLGTGPYVLVKYTYIGDANLDGILNIDDFLAAEHGYLMHLSGWANGDFDYSGTVDATDLNLLAAAFASQGSPLSAGFAAQLEGLALTPPPLAIGGIAAVPEPASLGILVLGAGMLLRRRGRGSDRTGL